MSPQDKQSPWVTGCTIAAAIGLLLLFIPICLIGGFVVAVEMGWIYIP